MDFINPYILQIIVLCGINIILTVSLNLINGFTGQFSLGHAGFMAIGAYVSAAFSVYVGIPETLPWFVQHFLFLIYLLAGGGVAALFGFLIGLPSLRLKGDYLAIVTLGFGEIIRVVILNLDVVGGARGFTNIPPIANFSWVFFWVLLTLFVISRLVYSVKGKAFMAVRDDEVAARSIGIPPTR
ncbi:MAG: branched-chain amino acid ABC transporter permease, partial [Deltaproteobacteria bacterium]|nr:branched-chain amino acid ABC transporter permease [Deltaproteobacteria bacterium]